ncbi:MAG: DUF4062 domain-containing protein [candidate division KSB1 bacterium]|jgi:hypothetical protein|nr:DUF4062 domain-containing protein [candidate division KSB1 bacterium]
MKDEQLGTLQEEHKYQIFVSSSFEDLRDERKAIIDQILKMDHIPAGMEMFQAGDEEDLHVIQKAIDQSDIYVIIVGARYGSVKENRSYTQIEFNYARQTGKPIIAFLLDNESFDAERERIIKEFENEKSYDKELNDFIDDVLEIEQGKRRLADFYKKGDLGDLKAKFVNAISKLVKSSDNKMLGWIRGYEDLLSLGPVAKNPFLREIVESLKEYGRLAGRLIENEKQKKAMALYFWDRCLADIIEHKYNKIFFESGSTIVYTSSELLSLLQTPMGRKFSEVLKITTNNILTYLQFVLTHNVDIMLTPYGPPENIYGATFGNFTSLPNHSAPGPDKLSDEAEDSIYEMVKLIGKKEERILLLVTASGLNLCNEDFPLGHHVGSYYNMLFKKSLIRSNCPLVIFLDSSKLKIEFDPCHCFAVCSDSESWKDVCKRNPIALCIGADSESKRNEIIDQIIPFGFVHIDPIDSKKDYGAWPILARNQKFHDIFPLPKLCEKQRDRDEKKVTGK